VREPGDPGDEPRPPGGKPLIRMLQLLEAAGYDDLAVEAVAAAVPEQALADAAEHLARFSAHPGDEPAARRALERGYPGPERTADAESVAAAHIAAATAGPAGLSASASATPPPGAAAAAQPPQATWVSLGPTTIPDGQTYGASRVNVSGRVAAILVDAADRSHLLVGAANGGVWESHDRGASWAPRTDGAATLAVGALAQDPREPAIVYCGTGEGNWWSWLGAGLLRSQDGGATWAPHCGPPFIGQGFYDLRVDPADGARLLAGTTGGLYLSTDAGLTWVQTRAATTWALALAPADAATETLAASGDGLFRSTDGGATWAAVTLPGAPAASWDRLSVVIAPSSPATAYAWGSAGGAAFLWRRAGGTWTAVTPPPGVKVNQAWYDWFLAVSPDLDTQIYCGAIDVHRGDLSGGAPHWLDISTKPAGGDSIHPDQHVIAFEPGDPDSIYVGNDGGLFHSPDRGVTWRHCNNGLEITELEYLAQDLGSAQWVIAGTQDNGTVRWTGSPTWTHIADGDGGHPGVNQANPRTVFHTYTNMNAERSAQHGDFGSWTSLRIPVPAGERSLFYPPLDCRAAGGATVAMAGGAVYVSRDNGTTWTRLAFPSAASASAACVATADDVYVGTTDGRLFHTTWNGTAWSALAPLATPRAGAYVSALHVEPTTQRRLWVTSTRVNGGRVFRSDDGGASWSDQTANLPGLPITAIAVDPSDATRAWVAADVGVYETTNAGGAWQRFGAGLPNVYVGDLAYHPSQRVLRAATRNRGMWQVALGP
jgi:photosystem II stability/assembly factor-like uncharacterized protein